MGDIITNHSPHVPSALSPFFTFRYLLFSPALLFLSQGCGCGTCYAAWGSQPNCNKPVDDTQFTGFAVPLGKWPNTPWVSTTQGAPRFAACTAA
jgi:hypothetical protein